MLNENDFDFIYWLLRRAGFPATYLSCVPHTMMLTVSKILIGRRAAFERHTQPLASA